MIVILGFGLISEFQMPVTSYVCMAILWQVKSVFVPTEHALTTEVCAPLLATLPLEVRSRCYFCILKIIFLDR